MRMKWSETVRTGGLAAETLHKSFPLLYPTSSQCFFSTQRLTNKPGTTLKDFANKLLHFLFSQGCKAAASCLPRGLDVRHGVYPVAAEWPTQCCFWSFSIDSGDTECPSTPVSNARGRGRDGSDRPGH